MIGLRGLSCWLLLSMTAACGSESAASHDAGPERVCEGETRADPYARGMVKHTEAVSITLVESTPGPPVKGANVWRLSLTNGSGDPVPGARVSVVPFMPDHGHGTSRQPVVTDLGGGEYQVDPVYLFMPGLWEVTVEVTEPMLASVMFTFCIEG